MTTTEAAGDSQCNSDSQVSTEGMASTDSGSQDSLPDTQPTFSGDGRNNQSVESVKKSSTWAYLKSEDKDIYRDVSIDKSVFVFGREDGDYIFKDPACPMQSVPDDVINQYSRKHFMLEKIPFDETKDSMTGFDVYLTDYGMNGTYVNGELVGKGNRTAIVGGDLISLTDAGRKAFKFSLIETDGGETADSSATLGGGRKPPKNIPPGLQDKYIIGQEIGTGSCGSVYLGYSKQRKDDQGYPAKVAIKVISRRGLLYNSRCSGSDVSGCSSSRRWSTVNNNDDDENFWQEVAILRKLDGHPCVISFEDVFDSPNMFVIVLELARGGELFDYVLQDYKDKSFDEKATKIQFYQIVSAIKYVHDMNVCHRDIKLENILLAEKNK